MIINYAKQNDKPKPKYKIGDKVTVCQDLKTVIADIEYSEKYQEFIYWFVNEKNDLERELEGAIEGRI